MDPFIIIAIGLSVFLGLSLCLIVWQARRSSRMIAGRADEHDYTVLEKKQPIVNLGPFRWENPHGRTFYRVVVRDGGGREHRGWVCCGAEWLGLFSNRVEVRWDAAETPVAPNPGVEEGVWRPPPER